jgi:ATP phosphoribosyltransferase
VPELTDVVVDLTETGSTLRKNGLKIIDVMLESTSELIANKKSWADPEKRDDILAIETLLSAVIRARGKVLLAMNVPEDKIKDVIALLPSMKNPTISKLWNSGYYAVETVVDKSQVNLLIPRLKKEGAEDILELAISKIVP